MQKTIPLDEIEVAVGKTTSLLATPDLWAEIDVSADHPPSIEWIYVGSENKVAHYLDAKEHGWLYEAVEKHIATLPFDTTPVGRSDYDEHKTLSREFQG